MMDPTTFGALAALFGGCCSSVITLEGVMLTQESGIGTLLTFLQFLVISIEGVFWFVNLRGNASQKRMHIPLRIYTVSVFFFYVSSLTNNSVFNYGISVPLHIMFRSSSTVITMVITWIFTKKRYSTVQIFSAILLTIGAVIASIFKETEFSWATLLELVQGNNAPDSIDNKFLTGISLLALSSIFSSMLSVYSEWVYKKYGNYWRESLFYTHALSLPLFFFQRKQLYQEYSMFKRSHQKLTWRLSAWSLNLKKEPVLIANLIAQQICIKSVNLFASRTTALTLSVTLLLRKFLSLLLSFFIFGSALSSTCYVGIGLVFIGASIYGVSSSSTLDMRKKRNVKKND